MRDLCLKAPSVAEYLAQEISEELELSTIIEQKRKRKKLLDYSYWPKPSRMRLRTPEDEVFPDRNLGTSQPSVLRDPAPPLLRAAQAWLSFGARSGHPSHQKSSTLNEKSEKAPFHSQGS